MIFLLYIYILIFYNIIQLKFIFINHDWNFNFIYIYINIYIFKFIFREMLKWPRVLSKLTYLSKSWSVPISVPMFPTLISISMFPILISVPKFATRSQVPNSTGTCASCSCFSVGWSSSEFSFFQQCRLWQALKVLRELPLLPGQSVQSGRSAWWGLHCYLVRFSFALHYTSTLVYAGLQEIREKMFLGTL